MIRIIVLFCLCGTGASADVLVPVRTIPAQTIIAADDLLFRDINAPGAVTEPAHVIGQETRVALFAGRPIRPADIGTPAVVDRNQVILMLFESAGLVIKTEGRALDRARPGEIIRVMNITSRTTVSAMIDAAGVAHVVQ